MAKLGTSALGKGRLWITDSRVSHSDDTPDEKLGRIQWIRFSVEILLGGSPANSMANGTARSIHATSVSSKCHLSALPYLPAWLRQPEGLCHYVLMPERPQGPDEPPPFLGTWRRVYTAILIYLCLLIGAFYLFTRAYR